MRPVIYVGSYAPQIVAVSTRGGQFVRAATVECPDSPAYLALAPDRRHLYVAHETSDGLLSAFAIGDHGALQLVTTQPSGGASPCHLSVHPSGRFVLAAHWGTGSFTVHPLGAAGELGPVSHLIDGSTPHAHMIATDSRGRFVLSVHMGMSRVSTFELDLGAGRLRRRSEMSLPEGAGPRHLAFHPDGRAVFVVNELASTITACHYDPETGELTAKGSCRTVPATMDEANHPSAIVVSRDGRFLFVGNRFHKSVGVLTATQAPRLVATYPCGGDFPRDIALDTAGRLLYIANERSDSLTALQVDPRDGSLTATDLHVSLPSPACVVPL
jgi:6-phosphogluconolactonase